MQYKVTKIDWENDNSIGVDLYAEQVDIEKTLKVRVFIPKKFVKDGLVESWVPSWVYQNAIKREGLDYFEGGLLPDFEQAFEVVE